MIQHFTKGILFPVFFAILLILFYGGSTMFRIEKLIAANWRYQCSTASEKEAVDYVNTYATDEVFEFKTCDALRVINEANQHVIIEFPSPEDR